MKNNFTIIYIIYLKIRGMYIYIYKILKIFIKIPIGQKYIYITLKNIYINYI